MNAVKDIDMDTFVRENERLVHSVCQRYVPLLESIRHITGAEYDDLFQVGMIGLMKAKKRFNPELGLRISTYAVPMIIGEIRRFLRDNSLVKTSRWIKEYHSKIKKLGLEDIDAETIAKELNISADKAVQVLNYSPTYRSISETVYKDEGSREDITLEETLSEDSFEDSTVNNYVLEEFMATLSERERTIWRLYHKENFNQAQIGKMFGISQVQVSRILSTIEKKAEYFGKKKRYRES